MPFPKGYSMNIFLVNFKTPEITLMVFFKFENITFSFKVGSGRFDLVVFISDKIYGRFGANRKLSLR